MGDPLKKVQDGDRLRIPAAAYNAFVDAARKIRAEQQGVGAKPLRSTRSTSIVLVQNNSGATVGRFGVLGIDGPIITPTAGLTQFHEQVALVGSTPAAGHRGKFVILLEPLADGAIGRAVVDGVAPCRVVFATGTETRADVLAGDTTCLNASAGGSTNVLWKEAGTGEKWAVVRLETALTSIVRFQTTATLALGGTAAAVIRVWDGAAYQDGEAIVVEDFSSPGRWSAVNGAEGVAVKLSDKTKYVILWIEHQAIFATATLTANMTAGTAACTFTDTWQGPSGVGAASQVYDLGGRYAGLLAGDKVLACWDDVESKYRICDGPQASPKEKWAYARTDWVNAAGNGSYVPCDSATGKDGESTGIDIGNVYLPRGGDYDPDVRQGEIIAYTETEDGFKIAKGYVSDRIGVMKIWSGSVATIARGWQLCDGTNGTPDLREKFVLCAKGDSGGTVNWDYDGHSTNVGNTGGMRRELINWAHTRFGETDLVTELDQQAIYQTESFYTGENDPLSVSATDGTLTASGQTDYALANILVYDPYVTTGIFDINGFDNRHGRHFHTILTQDIAVSPATLETDPVIENPLRQIDCSDDTGYPQTIGAKFYLDTESSLPLDPPHETPLTCNEALMSHRVLEPGQLTGGLGAVPGTPQPHPIDPHVVDPEHAEAGTVGHVHQISTLDIDASDLEFAIDGDPHVHPVVSGTLDGKLVIRDVTHPWVSDNWHYHGILLDNHQEFINRIPPYYALAYIQRVD
jgi:hypothetical protein